MTKDSEQKLKELCPHMHHVVSEAKSLGLKLWTVDGSTAGLTCPKCRREVKDIQHLWRV